MGKFMNAWAAVALAVVALVLPLTFASAAGEQPTVTVSDRSQTYTTSWGITIHRETITVPTGSTVKVLLEGKVLDGYKWEVTWAQAQCIGAADDHAHGGNGGLVGCGGKQLTPVISATTGDAAGFEFTMANPVLAATGDHFEATIKAPNLPTTVQVDYAYFPPLKPGETGNSAVKVFEVDLIVEPAP